MGLHVSATLNTTNLASSMSYQCAKHQTSSSTGARLDLQWCQLLNAEYLTNWGNSWIHTAIFDRKPVS